MIADIIHKIAAEKYSQEDETKYYPRPSMAGPLHETGVDTRCIRSMCYNAGGTEPKPLPGRAVLTFDDSSWHEELTLDWIRKSNFHVHSTQYHVNINLGLEFLKSHKCHCGSIVPDRHISGHIDGMLSLLEYKVLLEHKAVNTFSFDKIWNNVQIPVDYLFQTGLYLAGLQQEGINIKGLLLIKNKDRAHYLEIQIQYDPVSDKLHLDKMVHSNGQFLTLNLDLPWEIVKTSALKFQKVYDAVMTKTLPTRPYEMDSWRCEYCRWGSICWENYEEEFKSLTEDAEIDKEISDLCKIYLEEHMHAERLGEEARTAKKSAEENKEKIKNILIQKDIKSGKTNEYSISRYIKHNLGSINQEKIPRDILEASREPYISEILRITLRKKKEKK